MPQAKFPIAIVVVVASLLAVLLARAAIVRNGADATLVPVVAVAAALALWRPSGRLLFRLDAALESLSDRRHAIFVAAFGVAVLAYFWTRAIVVGSPLYPTYHDEHMYLLQARMLASGHLALPSHALPDFFDTFYVLSRPVYSSMYFPGTALAYVPAIWLGLPFPVWPMLIATAGVVVAQLAAERALGSRTLGLAVAICLLFVTPMGYLPPMTMSHPLAMAQGMGLFLAWLAWRDRPRVWLAAIAGALAGWMLITRPAEAVAFVVPVAIAVIAKLAKEQPRVAAKQLAAAVGAALPFLTLLAAHNYAVTGSPLKLPITLYAQQEFVGEEKINDPAWGPQAYKTTSTLRQKQVMFDTFVYPQHVKYATNPFEWTVISRTNVLLDNGLSNTLFLALLPFALVQLSDPRIRVAAGILAIFFGVYLIYNTFLPHYAVQVAPLLLCLVASSALTLRASAPPTRAGRIAAGYGLAMVAAAILSFESKPSALPKPVIGTMLKEVHLGFPREIAGRALVLSKFRDRDPVDTEPVYNLSAARIDDNRIVLAHDLGPDRNGEIIRYYAERQPDRELYLFDRSAVTLTPLGTVRDVAARMDAEAKARGGPATAPSTP